MLKIFYVNIVANLEQIFQQIAITINMLQAMLKNLMYEIIQVLTIL